MAVLAYRSLRVITTLADTSDGNLSRLKTKNACIQHLSEMVGNFTLIFISFPPKQNIVCYIVENNVAMATGHGFIQ